MNGDSDEDQVAHALEYVLSRLTTYYGQKADYLAGFIGRGLRAEGWFAMEALQTLSASSAAHTVQVEEVRGRSQGAAEFSPDLQIGIAGQSHQLAIKSLPLKGELDIDHYFSRELPPLFRWLDRLKERAALVTIVYPCSAKDERWVASVSAAEEASAVKVAGQREFIVPRPPLPLATVCVSLWRHASVVGET